MWRAGFAPKRASTPSLCPFFSPFLICVFLNGSQPRAHRRFMVTKTGEIKSSLGRIPSRVKPWMVMTGLSRESALPAMLVARSPGLARREGSPSLPGSDGARRLRVHAVQAGREPERRS